MLEPIKHPSCQLDCWEISGGAAVLAFIMCIALSKIVSVGMVFFLLEVVFALSVVLGWMFCIPSALRGITRAEAFVDAEDPSHCSMSAKNATVTFDHSYTQLLEEFEPESRKSEWPCAPHATVVDLTAREELALQRDEQVDYLTKLKALILSWKHFLTRLTCFIAIKS